MTRIRPMTAADLPLGLRLSRQAGWNQTEGDWLRALELQPDGCFVAEADGGAVGTTTTCMLGDVAWIGMVLVDTSARKRGIGTSLMQHALAFLDRRGVATIRLDATPMGLPLYARLGFAEQFVLARHAGIAQSHSALSDCVRPISLDECDALAQLDQQVTATDRRRLLQQLFGKRTEETRVMRNADGVCGFLTARPGHRAVQIGPCIADARAGPALFADAFHRYAGQQVFVDVPVGHEAATRLLQTCGLTVQRHLTRMCRGVPRCERIDQLWASSGPEKG
jgi:predicted N-acetyltransferase YhbS